jgi:hypothetical protein
LRGHPGAFMTLSANTHCWRSVQKKIKTGEHNATKNNNQRSN